MNTVERIELDNGYFIDLTTFPTYYEAYLGRECCPVRLQLCETDKNQFGKDFFTKMALVRAEEKVDSLSNLINIYASNPAPINGEIIHDSTIENGKMRVRA